MNNKEAIVWLKNIIDTFNGNCTTDTLVPISRCDVKALDLAIKALEIVDMPHIKDYIVINTQKVYLTQGHIDALLEYERKQMLEKIVNDTMKSLEDKFSDDFEARIWGKDKEK